jgi:type I restriction enzyme S subunit
MSSEWPVVRLGDHVDSCLGKMLDAKKNKGIAQRYLGNSNVRWGSFDISDLAEMRFEPHEEERYGLLPGDLIVCEGGEPGRCAIWTGEAGMKIQKALHRIRPKSTFNNYYLYYWMCHAANRGSLEQHFTGTTIKHLTGRAIAALEVRCPPIEVQLAMVDVLKTLDDRITLLRETNTTLEAIAQALFKSWFVDFDPVHAKMQGRAPEGMDEATVALFPDSFEESELGAVPKGWSVGSIGVIAEVIDCLHSKKPELIESPHPFLQLNNIRDDGLLDTSEIAGISKADYTKWISRIEVREGDCVITNVGRVGAVAQIPDGYKAAMGRNMTAVRLKKEYPFPTYLVELLQSPDMRTEISAKTDVGTILDALNVRSIPTLRCVLASRGVLSEFESISRPVRSKMEANIAQIQTLSNARDTLLPRLISGQLSLSEVTAQTV